MKSIFQKYLSISLSLFVLANCMPINCFAQNADFVPTENSKLIVPRINYGGSDLITESQQIYDRLMDLYDGDIIGDMIFFHSKDNSISKAKELKSILEDYKKFLINVNNSQEILKGVESGEISTFQKLTEKYFAEVPDYTQVAILKNYSDRFNKSNVVTYFYSYKESVRDIKASLEEDIKRINNIIEVRSQITAARSKGTLNKDSFEDIRNICRKYVSYLRKENSESVKAIYEGFEQYAAKLFPTQESKAEFLRYIWNRTIEIMENNEPGSGQKLLKGLLLHEGDTPRTIIKKLQQVLMRLGEEAPSHVKDSLKRMIEYINILYKEGRLGEYIAKANNELSSVDKGLITEVEGFIYGKNTMFSDLLLQDATNYIPGGATAKVTSKAGTAVKIITPALMILGTIWIFDMIVDINSKNNTFARVIDPAAVKQHIKDGTASTYEQFAFYMMPSSAKYIEEDPVRFASVMFYSAEAATNPAVEKMMNDPIMQIKGFENIGLNDAEIEQILNNIELEDLQLPQA